MVDSSKHIEYWRAGAEEDLRVAEDLITRGWERHGLFFAHLALEKLLKAVICRNSGDMAPRIHNLVRLAEIAGLRMNEAEEDLLADMNQFNVEGRYPAAPLAPLPVGMARDYFVRTREVLDWLIHQL